MAGQASGGQQLTPNRNVFAPAGISSGAGIGFGDRWGANGGGITPVGGGVTGQTGYDKSVAVTLSDGETATNYETNAQLGVIPPTGISGTVASLLHFNDGNGSTTFTDSSIPSNTWTAGGTNGTATESTTQTLFGQGSLFISGTNAFINTPYTSGSSLDLTQVQNWTIDMWVFPTPTTITNATNNGQSTVFDFSAQFTTMLRLDMAGSGKMQVQGFGATGTWNGISLVAAAALTTSAWNHVVVQRSGNQVYLGVNGVLLGGAGGVITGNAAAIGANQFAYIGASNNSNVQNTAWDGGYITEHRIVSGQALFGTGTSYTVPASPSGNPTSGNLPVPPPATLTALSQRSNGALSNLTLDKTLPTGNSNAG